MKLKTKSKKPDSPPKLQLEEVIGLTTKDANGLAANVLTGDCIYLAGCVVVVYNIHTGAQSHLSLSSRLPKPLTCLALSNGSRDRDGVAYIAAGELGHQPAVLIWEYPTRSLIAEMKGHRYGVACIDFSPDGKHMVSVGCSQDGYICVWDWRCGRLATKLKASTSCSSILSVRFSSDGSFFVTAGKQHLNLWTVSTKSRSKTGMGLLAIDGKPANVGCQKGSSFISVASAADNLLNIVGRDRTVATYPIFALTDAGVLCLLHSGFSVRRWVDLKVDKGYALSVSDKLIACACSHGIVQLFTVENLKYVGSLLYSETNDPHLNPVLSCHANSNKSTQGAATRPDAIACQFTNSEKLVVVYGDHSLYVWDVHEVPKVSRCCILVSHSGCIWDVENLPCRNLHDPALACVARGSCLGVTFATCSADGTIRLWDFALKSDMEKDSKPETALNQYFSSSLNTEQVGTIHLVSSGTYDQVTVEAGARAQGYRSMAVSSDGNYLAAGDHHGNLHLYNLHTSDYTCFQELQQSRELLKEVHDAEILSLSFSAPKKTNASTRCERGPHYLLASGGRDQIINVYDINRSFDLIGSIDDHSAAVTSVKLTCNGCSILSCSADRSVLFRDVDITDAGFTTLRCHRQTASHGIVYDMAIDPLMEAAVTVGQDKKINIFNITSGKLVKTFKQDPDYGEPIKVAIDGSGSFVVCSYSNRSLSIYDFASGKILGQATGHAEVITGVIFLPDCEHIISVGGDSCIFVWRLPTQLSSMMSKKIIEHAASPSQIFSSQLAVTSEGDILHDENCHQLTTKMKDISELGHFRQDGEQVLIEEGALKESSAFKFSISRLPKWAQNHVTRKETVCLYPESNLSQKEFPLPVAGNCEPSSTIDSVGIDTPCHLNLGSSKICHAVFASESPSSSSSDENSREIPRNIDMEKRWHTIHTVCLDLLDSPELRDLKDIKVPVLVSNLRDPPLDGPGSGEGSDIILGTFTATGSPQMLPICGPSKEEVNGGKWSAVSEQVKYKVANLFENEDDSHVQSAESNCGGAFDKALSEQLCLEGSQNHMQTTEDVEKRDRRHQEDSLFSQHFSNLSTTLKVEGRKSSARRSFSARFVVCRDRLTGCKRLFETSTENLGTEDFSCDEAAHLISSRDLTDCLSNEQQCSDRFHQAEEKANGSWASPRQSDSTNSIPICCLKNGKIHGDQRKWILEGNELQERIIECRATLLALDTAAEKALRLFVELGTPVAQEDASGGLGAELSDLASKLLPSTLNRVRALYDLVQSSKTSSTSDTAAEASELEPLIERFVESFSSQVHELAKKNI